MHGVNRHSAIMEGYTSLDIKGVLRGHCNFENACACDGYTRALDIGPQDASATFKSSWCAYCGQSPAHHVRLGKCTFFTYVGAVSVCLVAFLRCYM